MLDFQIVAKVIHLARITNQIKQNQNMRSPELDLESSLLNFAKIFKTHVMESRVLILCNTIYVEQMGEVEGQSDSFDTDFESPHAMQVLAQLCGQTSIQECLQIFTDKIVQNLMSLADSPKLKERRIVDEALDVFNNYLSNHLSCR